MTDEGPEVAVVGSLNFDVAALVPHLPARGETVLAETTYTGGGGKGANQAVAAARLGRRVAMVGRVGADEAGRHLRESLDAEGIDVRSVLDTDAPTGAAYIAVDGAGDNQIVVAPGANAHLTAEDVRQAAAVLEAAAVTMVQLEVPLDAVEEALRVATGTVVLSPAPARPLAPGILEQADVLVPNETELAILAGVEDVGDAATAADLAHRLGARAVLVTRGERGALVVAGGRVEVVPSPEVDAVDTTGAGDAFCGAVADALARGETVGEAAAQAVRVAAVACTRPGAQASLPTPAEVAEVLG